MTSFSRALSLMPVLLVAAASCDSRMPLASTTPLGGNLTVTAIAPANGAGFGPAGGTHPALRWRSTAGAARFHLQVDDSCTGPAACAFPSPEIDEPVLTETSYVPAVELPYQATA